MQLLSATSLITALAIVFNDRAVDAQNVIVTDQVSVEANGARVVVEGPQQEKPPLPAPPLAVNQTNSPQLRPPSKPPIHVVPDKKPLDIPRHYYSSAQKHQALPLHRLYTKDQLKQLNPVYKYHNAMRPTPRSNLYSFAYSKPPPRQPLIFAASTKTTVAKPATDKYSIPVQTINGIRTDFVRPPHFADVTTTTTTQTPTTTRRVLRTKRIWPKRILEKMNITQNLNDTIEKLDNVNTTTTTDLATASSNSLRIRYADRSVASTTPRTSTRGYRPVTRVSKVKYTTPANTIKIEENDWVPILPSHYSNRKTSQTHIRRRRSSGMYLDDNQPEESKRKNLVYLHSYGLLPVSHQESNIGAGVHGKNMVFFRKKKRQQSQYTFPSLQPNPYMISAETRTKAFYNPAPAFKPASYLSPAASYDSLQPEESFTTPAVTKVKHHHHHHHHRYVKTVEKPVEVPVKVEVPKPYPVEKKVPVPVPVEKVKVVDRPYPVPVEKKVPYPVTVRVPQPVPVKVVEKEYVPKPFPVVHHVPVVKHVEVKVPQPVPVQVEKRIPYPVQVPVPIEKQVPFPIPVEKQVPYPVPVKVYVPKPYPVEKRVPYAVKVREEVIRHINVPIIRPYAVKVPYPVTVEKRVPYPVEVYVPQKIHVEKKVPIYIPKPYPVEKKVPYPVRVPYPVKVPVQVPVKVPVYIHHPFQILNQHEASGGGDNQYYGSQYGSLQSESPYYNDGVSESSYYGDADADRIGRSGSDSGISRSDSQSTTVVPTMKRSLATLTKS